MRDKGSEVVFRGVERARQLAPKLNWREESVSPNDGQKKKIELHRVARCEEVL